MADKINVKMSDGESLAVFDHGGANNPIVFVHGFPESHVCWDDVIDHVRSLSPSDRKIFSYDLRGHGESAKRGEATWQRLLQDHFEVVKELGINSYHLVGHDWGGAIALHAARFDPESLATIAVLNTNYWKTDVAGMWHMVALNLPLIPSIALRYWSEQVFDFAIGKGFKDVTKLKPRHREQYLDCLKDPETVKYWIRLYRGMARALLAQHLPKPLKQRIAKSKVTLPKSSRKAFKVKAAVVWGKEDTFNPLWVGRDICANLRERGSDVAMFEIEDAGHFVQEEQPAVVAKYLVNLWSDSLRSEDAQAFEDGDLRPNDNSK